MVEENGLVLNQNNLWLPKVWKNPGWMVGYAKTDLKKFLGTDDLSGVVIADKYIVEGFAKKFIAEVQRYDGNGEFGVNELPIQEELLLFGHISIYQKLPIEETPGGIGRFLNSAVRYGTTNLSLSDSENVLLELIAPNLNDSKNIELIIKEILRSSSSPEDLEEKFISFTRMN